MLIRSTGMHVPYLDLARDHKELSRELDDAIARVVGSGRLVLNREVEAFEQEFARFTGAAHCVGVGNGHDAIRLALTACGIGQGDEVIVPAYTCTPTWLGVAATGATLRPVDSNPRTFNVETAAIAEAIGERTRAIVPVHLYGQPADMAEIAGLADRHGLSVVQDCAQAHGATSHGRPLGTYPDAAAWSFYPTKNLGALGDAGAVTTNSVDVAERVRELRNYGASIAGLPGRFGANSRLDEIQAAVLRVKLRHLPERNERRRNTSARYLTDLQSAPVMLPVVADHARPSWHMFVIRSPRRDGIASYLQANGVETLVRYTNLPYDETAFAGPTFDPRRFPNAELLRRQVLSLPVGPHLDRAQVGRVVDLLRSLPEEMAIPPQSPVAEGDDRC